MRCANQLIVEIESLGENKNNLRRLIEQLSTPIGVIPFIGAGMSIPFGFQGWTEFLLSLASSPTLKSQLKRYIRAGRYEEAAGELCEALGNRGFHDAIENEYGDHKLQDKSLVGAASHLPELVTGPIITTNFDHVLERVFSRASRPFEHVVSGAKADMVAKALHQNRRFLLKIHGDVDDRTDRILTQTDYQKHYCSIPAEQVDFSLPLPRLLQQMTMSRPLFFIGCSLSHDRTVTVLKKVAADFPAIAHYAIVEFPSSRAQYLKQQRHLSKHSIRPVWYTRGRHDLITSLLKYLIEQANGSDSRWRTSVATDLPRSRTSFIGRQKMIVETKQLLSRTTLLTLTGSPGCGKTRLAFQIAEESKSQYHDGVFTIELAALSKSSLLPETIASNLGLREDVTHSVTDTLIGYLREKSLLLVIDNCEHLLADCAILITEILQKCSRVRILTTSREPLHVLGEIELDVPPLTFPPLSSPIIETNALMDYEAIQLFVERASFTSQTFTLTEQNGQFVAQICQRLDGIPLAIELAAAHVKTLTTQQISEELDNRFVILQADDPTVLRRNKQMKAAIDWSYGLLSKPEKTLFRRLSIFMGGRHCGDFNSQATFTVDRQVYVSRGRTA